MQMQVDLPSPQAPLSVSLKRPRSSSPSQSPVEQDRPRPTKRPTLGLRTSPLVAASKEPGRASSSDTSRRIEDWVSRTGGLHLDSPHLSCGESTGFSSHASSTTPSELGNDVWTRGEENMRVEFEAAEEGDAASYTSPSISLFVTPPQPSNVEQTSPSEARTIMGFQSSSNSLAPPVLSLRIDHLTPSTNPQGPHIHISPPTPSSRQGGASLPASPMAISPSGSSIWTPPLSPNSRKARLTMGPRADCPKCREGIKGHWIHYD